MLNKVLFKNQERKQLVIAMIGAFLGITFLVMSIHYLIKVNEFGKGSDILGPNTIIVQKKVTPSTTIGLTKSDFSPREIEKIKSEKFVLDVKPVVSNNFNLWFETDDEHIPTFKTNLFIQTIDPSFLKANLGQWKWKEGDPSVPIILPRDFIVMMNTFASSAGFPQVSDELAMNANFKFMLSNKDGKKEWMKVKIIGFTSSVSAVLVPETFMQYGNENFANGEEQKISQIMISGKENEFGRIEELLTKKGLESKDAQMIVGRLKSMVGTLFFVVLCISVVAVFVSGLVLIQYMQLLISKNAYEIRTLMRIGYHPKTIVRKFFVYFLKVFGIVSAAGLICFLGCKYFLDEMFESGGVYIDKGITLWSVSAVLFAHVLFSLSSYFTAKKETFNAY
ncbi:hypothetical protein N9C33_00540 [Crocinitomicaceae bacterium]|nr:hypothetical protein [Crocinitomicaceae bacterium]